MSNVRSQRDAGLRTNESVGRDGSLPETTDARFSMRALFVAMTTVAVLAAIAGAVLQQLQPAVRQHLITLWAIWLTVMVAYVFLALFQRRRAERQAGPIILRLSAESEPAMSQSRSVDSIRIAIALLVAFLLMSAFAAINPAPKTSVSDWLFSLLFPIVLVMMSANTLPAILWHNCARFCQHGILYDRKVLRWDKLVEYRWAGFNNDKLQLYSADAPNNQAWLSFAIGDADRAAVMNLLDEKLSSESTLPKESRLVGINQVPISAVVMRPHLRRHLVPLSIGIACGIVLAYFGLQGVGSREFDQSIVISVWVWIIFSSAQWRWTTRGSGKSLARLFARQDWLEFLGTFAAAAGIYVAFIWPLWWPAWIGYTAGFTYSWLTLRTLTYFFKTQLDLRDDCVVMPGVFQWPWSNVRLRSWDPDVSGRLVLGRGFRRVIAQVPASQRGVVDELIREKLKHVASTTAME